MIRRLLMSVKSPRGSLSSLPGRSRMRPRCRDVDPSSGLAEYLGIYCQRFAPQLLTHIRATHLGYFDSLLCPISRVDDSQPIVETKNSPS